MKLISKLMNKHVPFKRLLGINIDEFRYLSRQLAPAWRKTERMRLTRDNRKRKQGAGRRYSLGSMEDKLAMFLMYYRIYASQELISFLFGIDQSNVSRLIAKLEPLIEQAADPSLKNYLEESKANRTKMKVLNLVEFTRQYPDAAALITDATEVRCNRPKRHEIQKQYYSGKRKCHTLKTQITISKNLRIVNVSKTYPGSVHDKKIIDTEKTLDKVCSNVPHWFDKGYQGLQKDYQEHYNILPIKRKPKRKLSELAKELNKMQSKIRVPVEHVFAKLKRFKICSQVFRNPFHKFNQIFRNIAAIHNMQQSNTCKI